MDSRMENIRDHIKINDKLLDEFQQENNIKQFIEKYIKFKNDERLLIEKLNHMRDEFKRLGCKVPPKLK